MGLKPNNALQVTHMHRKIPMKSGQRCLSITISDSALEWTKSGQSNQLSERRSRILLPGGQKGTTMNYKYRKETDNAVPWATCEPLDRSAQ